MTAEQRPQSPRPQPKEGAKREDFVAKNVLADRYASFEVLYNFSEIYKHRLQRGFWIEIMQAQHDLGVKIPQVNIDDYKRVRDDIDLTSIRAREIVSKQDQAAMIEEFNALAGHQNSHEAMTSRDNSDNVEQSQIKSGLEVIRDRTVATLAREARLAAENSDLVYAGRSHLVPGQPNLIGKLFTDTGEELLIAYEKLEDLIEKYPLRGIKGAMGTQTDMLQLFEGDADKVAELERRVANYLGFENILGSVGQIYPRSLDFEVVSTLFQALSGPANLAATMRQMAANEEFTEGFKEGQVGSNAMPHKMNARTSERIKALKSVVAGHVTMAGAISGEQLYAGDVSESAARRIFIPDSFYATDGIFQAILTVLDEGAFYPAVINAELERYLPFLTTTRLLTTAIMSGVGREQAHKTIRDHAVAIALEMREKGRKDNDLLDRLASDARLGLTKEQLQQALSKPIEFVGTAPQQIRTFVLRVEKIVAKHPEAAAYIPEEIL